MDTFNKNLLIEEWSESDLRELWDFFEEKYPKAFATWIELYRDLRPKLEGQPRNFEEASRLRSASIQHFINRAVILELGSSISEEIAISKKKMALYDDMVSFFNRYLDNVDYLEKKSFRK